MGSQHYDLLASSADRASSQQLAAHYSDFTIKWATLDWEIRQAHALRRSVFCDEQGIFEKDDIDEIDYEAQVLVAIANHGGWHEKIVGTVRIHQPEEGIWWGSRLAVQHEFRKQVGLGANLILLAVSSAYALGCVQFLAQVQKKNEAFFQRLNWQSQFDLDVRNHPHVMMQADLSEFTPCFQPTSGFVVKSKRRTYMNEVPSPLLYACIAKSATYASAAEVYYAT
jgi:putative N-acetyltransferase (TIGR04045 family)|tara:strand:- start:215 stop:889 length:675 start_codon:yes stop_codon:yes gene_type:complete